MIRITDTLTCLQLFTVNVTGKIKQTKPFWEKKMYSDADFT